MKSGALRCLLKAIAPLLAIAVAAPACAPAKTAAPEAVGSLKIDALPLSGTDLTYRKWKANLSGEPGDGDAVSRAEPIVLAGAAYKSVSADGRFEAGAAGDLLWNDAEGWAEWEVDIREDGLYEIGLVYDSLNDQTEDLFRSIEIDGKTPYADAVGIRLKRSFRSDPETPRNDPYGNEIRPNAAEEKTWQEQWLTNYEADHEPLLWPLRKGKRTIRVIGSAQPIRIKQLLIATAGYSASAVREAIAEPEAADPTWIGRVEAERFARKSNTGIQLFSVNDALISPAAKGFTRYNAIGGETFRESGKWIEWEFTVPEDGRYRVGFKYLQGYANSFNVYRDIRIDGLPLTKDRLPFAFPFGSKWQGLTLEDRAGEPVEVPLKQGRHTLRMTVTASPVKPIQEHVVDSLQALSRIENEIRKITGNFEKSLTSAGNTDTNRDWDLEKYIPDLRANLTGVGERFREAANLLGEVTTDTSNLESRLRTAAADLFKLQEKPRLIPNRLNVLVKLQSDLSSMAYEMLYQPLLLDYLWIAREGAKLPRTTPTLGQNLLHMVSSFSQTFDKDYAKRRQNPEAIEVWVNRNRDYANLIQQLADETFTVQTGIPVNVNIVPDAQLLVLGNAANLQPDVALGVDQAVPVDYASRGALVDLTQFKDFGQLSGQFLDNSLEVFRFGSGIYALPEVQSFNVLFYRKDILEPIGLAPPDTWSDVYRMLPALQQHGYDFYINPKDYLTFLYQNGAELYTPDGLYSALDTEEALKGFRQWTNLFALYRLPREVPNFFNHFRLGDIPIGVSDFNAYLQLHFSAPELAGKWALAPVPGTAQPDGSVARWSGGPMSAGILFEKSANKQEGWQFLKWWASEETQVRFGVEIESIYGSEYRWNTANSRAFARLPWPEGDKSVLEEQRKWFKEAPQVPGGYFTPRQIDFAWNNVVLQGRNARESLERAVDDINREMYRKQQEFGWRDQDGRLLKPPESDQGEE